MFFILLLVVYRLLQLYTLIIVIGAVLSWLIAFDVINVHNDAARGIITLIAKVTEPVYRPIRKIIPPVGGLDLSPLVLLVGIWLIETAILEPLMARSFIY